MKKTACFVLFVVILTACNNSAEKVKTTDSTSMDVNTKTETNKDTSSYERMPGKTNDSMQQ